MLSGIHFLLTYQCPYECDHCFVYGGPKARGTFTREQIVAVLQEAQKLGTVRTVFFEGGEPFLYYPLLLEGVRIARKMGFHTGIVTNGYFATSVQDAILWLKPLQEAGIGSISFSLQESQVLCHNMIRGERCTAHAAIVCVRVAIPLRAPARASAHI
jgi:MoaA/NifB/PqqE/SkfB family radical SAM enzyme